MQSSMHCLNTLLPPKKTTDYVLRNSDNSYVLPQCSLNFLNVLLLVSFYTRYNYRCNLGFFYQLCSFTCNHARLLCDFLIKYEYEYITLLGLFIKDGLYMRCGVVFLLQQWSCVVSDIGPVLEQPFRLRLPSGSWCNLPSPTFLETSSGIRLQLRRQTFSFPLSSCKYRRCSKNTTVLPRYR